MSAAASQVLSTIPGLWRGLGATRADAHAQFESTGLPELDRALVGGWPRGALSQWVTTAPGLGFSLLVPLLARLTRAGQAAALVAPPYIPFAPALHAAGIDLRHLTWIDPKDRVDALWATEQMLRAGLFAVVASWSPSLDAAVERRLQLAAEAGRSVGIVAQTAAPDAQSVAAVRLAVSAVPSALRVEVLRCRGAHAGACLDLPWDRAA